MPSHQEFYERLSNISVNADTLNLNTDQVETKLDTANGILTTLSADTALVKDDIANGVTINQPVAVTDNNGSLTVDGTVTANAGTGTFAVSAASLPLPSGAATSANQTTANTSLSNIDTDIGALADSAATTDTGSFSLISLFKRLLSTKIPNSASGRIPVDGSGVTQPVSGTVTAAQTTAANLNATVVGSGSFTAAQATAANLNATVVQGTATSLKTQAENYQGGSAVGSGNPLQVTLANTGANSTAILTTNRGSTGEATVSNFTSTTSATLKSSNSSRKVLTIYNEGAGNLHVLYGSGTASTTNYSVKLFSGDYLEIDKYTGQVNAIFATAGTARVTEIT